MAKFIRALQWEEVPEAVRRAAGNAVFDTVGVGIGACGSDQIRSVIRELARFEEDGRGVSIWGQGLRMSLQTAVFVNALQGHTLELDDVHTRSKTHIGTVVVPAAWAMAESCKSSGRELLLAVLCAYETVARIGMALGVSAHRNLGWHATSTAGIFGAAAACGKLLGLTEDQLVSALGMAGQEAGGTWAFLGDGANCKVLNPAMAAVNGARCAILARAGMTGPEHVLTASDGGMLAAMSDHYDASLAARDLGAKWEILCMDNKPYPCCRSTHCVIDGILSLREKYGLRAGQTERIEVATYQVGRRQCGMSRGSICPQTPAEAKFSSPFAAAVALLYGAVELKHFEPEMIGRAEVQELLARVNIIEDDIFTERYPEHWGCRIRVYTKAGAVLEETVSDASGSVEHPLSERQLIQKISGILHGVMADGKAESTVKLLLGLESAPCIADMW